MTDTPDTVDVDTIDHEHYVSDEEWATIVEEAQRVYDDRVATAEEKGGAGDLAPMGLTPKITRWTSKYDKDSTLVRTQLFVIHTGETPLKVGFADSLTKWGTSGYQPRASWHFFVDPATIAHWISTKKAAWHAAGGNPYSLGFEQSGYASFTRDKWLSPDGLRQIDLLAQCIAVFARIPVAGLQWLTDQQVKNIITGKDKSTVGLCTHEQVSRMSGRTSRTDPGKGYPKDVLLDFIRYYHPDTSNVMKPAPVIDIPRGWLLTEDGIADLATVKAFGRMWGVKNPTGKWDEATVKAAQRWAKTDEFGKPLVIDGKMGPRTRGGIQKKVSAPIEPWSYGWPTKPTRTTRFIEAYYNRGVRAAHKPI